MSRGMPSARTAARPDRDHDGVAQRRPQRVPALAVRGRPPGSRGAGDDRVGEGEHERLGRDRGRRASPPAGAGHPAGTPARDAGKGHEGHDEDHDERGRAVVGGRALGRPTIRSSIASARSRRIPTAAIAGMISRPERHEADGADRSERRDGRNDQALDGDPRSASGPSTSAGAGACRGSWRPGRAPRPPR
jgi:hypothetical protein